MWQPTDEISVKLSGMHQQIRSDNNAIMTIRASDHAPSNGDLRTPRLANEPFNQDLGFYVATLNWDLGWAALTSATSYSRSKLHVVDDITPIQGRLIPLFTGGAIAEGMTPAPLDLKLRKLTQEVRLTSPSGGQIEWLVGGFFTREKWDGYQELQGRDLSGVLIPGLDPAGFFRQDETYKEGAIFGDLTYKFTEAFDVTVGARVARNRERFHSKAASVVFSPIDVTVRDTANIFTYMISPRWHLSPDAMVYARIASGYRPGGGNASLFPIVPPTVDADTLVNYEVGVKAELLDRRVTLDASLFYIDWKDIQVKAVEPTTRVDYIANGPTARSQGVEFSVIYRPVTGLRLGVNGSYVDAQLRETADPSLNLTAAWTKGARLPLSPKFSGAITADYDFPLGDTLTGNVGGGVRYVGDRLTLIESDVSSVRLGDYTVVDLNVGVTSDRWTMRLFGKNLTDERALLSTRTAGAGGILYATVLQPRTIGVALDLNF